MFDGANRRILTIGPSGGLAEEIASQLAATLPSQFLADDGIDWTRCEAVEATLRDCDPVIVLHEPAALAQQRWDALLQRGQYLAEACRYRGCRVMHLSDYYVFGGDTRNVYREGDSPAPLGPYGETLLALEQCFAEAVEQHMILRFSWLIDSRGDNLLTRTLAALTQSDSLSASSQRRGAPTWTADASRVVVGILHQVISGARNWGYFHYCSTDSCNEREFTEEVKGVLEELGIEATATLYPTDSGLRPDEPASATLDSRRVRDNFGVHGRSWRQGLKARVRHWLEAQQGVSAEALDSQS